MSRWTTPNGLTDSSTPRIFNRDVDEYDVCGRRGWVEWNGALKRDLRLHHQRCSMIKFNLLHHLKPRLSWLLCGREHGTEISYSLLMDDHFSTPSTNTSNPSSMSTQTYAGTSDERGRRGSRLASRSEIRRPNLIWTIPAQRIMLS